MNTSKISSTKPYLLRAIFEWANDNSFTPQVLVNADVSGVEVPLDHVVDGQIVLNIGLNAIQLHVMDNECLSFSARFSGVEQDIFLPMESIVAIFARENSQGIFFEEIDNDDDPEPTLSEVSSNKKSTDKTKSVSKKDSKPHLKVIK
ncbi:MAG: ClpXP protease specificity-enhancing factor [Acidiferrobacterales bacterium]|nr:ClpXP protease specificity-enhancing factor [Acidiferrobacterales bacterium]